MSTDRDDRLFAICASFERIAGSAPLLFRPPPEWAAAAHAMVVGDTVHYLWSRRKEGNFWVLMHSTAPTRNPAAVTHDPRNPVLLPSHTGFDNYTVEYPFPFRNPADGCHYAYYLGRRRRLGSRARRGRCLVRCAARAADRRHHHQRRRTVRAAPGAGCAAGGAQRVATRARSSVRHPVLQRPAAAQDRAPPPRHPGHARCPDPRAIRGRAHLWRSRAAQPVDMWTTAAQFPTYPQAQQQEENSRSSTLLTRTRRPAIPIVAAGRNS